MGRRLRSFCRASAETARVVARFAAASEHNMEESSAPRPPRKRRTSSVIIFIQQHIHRGKGKQDD
eukprot:6571753-Prymnesium_polylepis.1